MIKGKFETAEGAKSVGFPHGDFCLVVQALDDAAGKQLLSPEIVEDQLAVLAHGACDLLHGLDAGAHDLTTPFVELCSRSHNSTYVTIFLMWPKRPAVRLSACFACGCAT